jgi:hypothetical protein
LADKGNKGFASKGAIEKILAGEEAFEDEKKGVDVLLEEKEEEKEFTSNSPALLPPPVFKRGRFAGLTFEASPAAVFQVFMIALWIISMVGVIAVDRNQVDIFIKNNFCGYEKLQFHGADKDTVR